MATAPRHTSAGTEPTPPARREMPPVARLFDSVELSSPLPDRSALSDKGAQLPRQASDRTRDDLLTAAVLLVNERIARGPSKYNWIYDPLPSVQLTPLLEIASAVSYARRVNEDEMVDDLKIGTLKPGAFYKAFAGMYPEDSKGAALTHFRAEVARRMVEQPYVMHFDLYMRWADEMHSKGFSLEEVIVAGVTSTFKNLQKVPGFYVLCSLGVYALDPAVRSWIRPMYRSQIEGIAKLFSHVMDLYDLDMVDGLDVSDMAVAVNDLVTGRALHSRFEGAISDDEAPEDVPSFGRSVPFPRQGGRDSGVAEIELCARAALAIISAYTRRR